MTEDSFLRTGQVAKRVGRSSYEVRRLLESGLIQGEYTGNQWRIPLKEVDRLEREGVPDIPVSLREPDDEPDAWENEDDSPDHDGDLHTTPSREVIAATDDVAIEEARARATRHRLDRRKTERELAETDDFFQEREDRERERQAAERRKSQAAAAEQQRIEWRDSWLNYAKGNIPNEAGPEVWLEVCPLLCEALEKMPSTQSRQVIQSIVDAVVTRALAPWRQQQQAKRAIEGALSQLPWSMSTNANWHERAVRAAAESVVALGADASFTRLQAAAIHAVESVKKNFEHVQQLERMVDHFTLTNATEEERADARDSVRTVLAALPSEASDRQLEVARNSALEPFRARIRSREDKKMREGLLDWFGLYRLSYDLSREEKESVAQKIRAAFIQAPECTPRAELETIRDRMIVEANENVEKRKAKKRLIEQGLREIGPYLRKLQQDDWDFDEPLSSVEAEVTEPIREELAEKLSGNEAAEYVSKLVRRLVRLETGIDG